MARDSRSLHGRSCAAFFALNLGLLAACSQLPINNNQEVTNGPQIMDRVRSLDLLPRFPQQAEPTGQSAGTGAKAQVYNGVTIPAVEGARPQPASSGEGYELNFENTPIASVAKVVLGDILMTGYTIDPRVTGMISLSSGRPVPKSDLLFVLENALRLSGVVLVKDVQGYRLIPLGDAVGAGNLDMAEAHADPGYGVSVVPLRYVSASTLIKLLDSFATKPGTVRADTSRNMLLIQGSGAERRTAIETVLGFDVDWMRGQSVGVFPIRYTSPEPIITELEKIMDSGEGGLTQNTVKFQPIARLNAILVVARKPDLLRSAETWIKRLDAADTARAGVHVYHVKYGEARQLARVLNDVFVGGGGAFETPASQVRLGHDHECRPLVVWRPLGERQCHFWGLGRRRRCRWCRCRRRYRWRREGGRRRLGDHLRHAGPSINAGHGYKCSRGPRCRGWRRPAVARRGADQFRSGREYCAGLCEHRKLSDCRADIGAA